MQGDSNETNTSENFHMRIEYTLYKEWKSVEQFKEFIQQCEDSGCYPWSTSSLLRILDGQLRYPNRFKGYTPSQNYYDCRWTYSEQDREQVEGWLSWMVLKHTLTFERTMLIIDEANNRVTRKEII